MGETSSARDKLMAVLSDPENLPAATRHLGYQLSDIDPETSRVEAWFTAKPEFLNPNGSVQGGLVSAFLDEAMSLSVFVATHLKAAVPTLEMKTTFPASAHDRTGAVRGGNRAARPLGRLHRRPSVQ